MMAEYDLTPKIVPFLDLHLVIPLLEFLEARKLYNYDSLIELHRKVLLQTCMIDGVAETYPPGTAPDFEPRRTEILEKRDSMKAKLSPLTSVLETEPVKSMMDSRDGINKALEYLSEVHGFTIEMIEPLFAYAKFQYDCGNYSAAAICLWYYQTLLPEDSNCMSVHYGKLASEILLQEWSHAKDELEKIRLYMESRNFTSEMDSIQQRAWVMHWALFVYFNYPKGRDEIIEMFLNQSAYLNTIQVACPHLLRYLAVAVVTSKTKQKTNLEDLIKVIDIERHTYQDPVTDFLTCLYIKYDFDNAQKKLRQCEDVLANDFFLTACQDDFRESARLLIFEMFCRIHQCISIEMLAERLNMNTAEAERWIVDLIRNYRIEGAKIDSKLGQVVMGNKSVSIYEQVMECTKRLTFRTQQIALHMEKMKLDRKVAWKAEDVK